MHRVRARVRLRVKLKVKARATVDHRDSVKRQHPSEPGRCPTKKELIAGDITDLEWAESSTKFLQKKRLGMETLTSASFVAPEWVLPAAQMSRPQQSKRQHGKRMQSSSVRLRRSRRRSQRMKLLSSLTTTCQWIRF